MYEVEGNVLPYYDEQLTDQGEDSGDGNNRNEDDLKSAIFEARCMEEVNVNNW